MSEPMEVNKEEDIFITTATPPQKRDTGQRKTIYRSLLNKVEDIEDSDEFGLHTVKEIHSIFKEVNELEDECHITTRVSKADETLLDSKVLSTASSLLVKCVEFLDVFSSTYEPTDLANGIVRYLQGVFKSAEEPVRKNLTIAKSTVLLKIQFVENATENAFESKDILKLFPEALKLIPQVPCYKYIYGTYDLNKIPEPKKKKERQIQVKEKLAKKQPTQIKNVADEEDSIDHIVKLLHEVLMEEYVKNGKQPIKYYEYVIDIEDFANTVENMFYCSFLIRNGQAHIDLDRKGVPYIKPMKKKKLKEYRDDEGANYQMISTISVPEWERYKTPGFIQKYKKRMSTTSE